MTQADINEILAQVSDALSREDWDQAVIIIESLRPADQAEVFTELPEDSQDQLLPLLNVEDSADILEELDEPEAAEVALRLGSDDLARILDEMEPDEAADLLGDIAPEVAVEALQAIKDAQEILPFLAHPDETAGGLMTATEVVLNRRMTVAEALAHLRSVSPDADIVYYLFVVDDDFSLAGVVSLRQLVISAQDDCIEDIMDSEVISVLPDVDQEEAARLLNRYDLLALPVVDERKHLLGVITHDDLMDVLEDEATEDIYRLGGVPQDGVRDDRVMPALRSRLPWLVLNLGTAMASAAVLSLFESTIARVAVLAAFFPMVAGVSGSAGTQTLTVTVRKLALGELAPRDGWSTLWREIAIGVANGIAVGLLVAAIALVWKGMPVLGLVVGLAILLNMLTAGIAGVLVPIVLQLFRIDPALASPVLVTTTTDTVGYLAFLGIATLILVPLF
jgi:magnesium transporter